ncbi:MAG TPA: hypothetical protein VN947_21340 [Polyangia bacterium]|nr:hypothetical protein [Polyangia bacterium]
MRGAVGVALVAVCAMATALGGVGCHEGNGLGAADMTMVDMTPPADLLPPVDLLPPPNCGQIVFCALGCLGGGGLGGIGGIGGGGGGGDMAGSNPISCVLGCGSGASSTDVTAAISLVVCAAGSCLAADGGASGTLGILQCLQMSCPSQLSACHGLGLGG